jgi:hypothetical protein
MLFLLQYPEFLPPSSSSSSSALVGKSSALVSDIHKAEQQQQKRRKMLAVLKSAITHTPWCKEIYISGLEGVVCSAGAEQGGGGKGREKAIEKWEGKGRERGNEGLERELKEVWRVMGEKGVRVHIDLEDVWDREG